jgi:hypothetical protein
MIFFILNVGMEKVNDFLSKAQLPDLHNCAAFTNVISGALSLTKGFRHTSIFLCNYSTGIH